MKRRISRLQVFQTMLPQIFAIGLLVTPGAAQVADEPHRPTWDDAMAAICKAPAQDHACVLEGKRLTYWLSLTAEVDGRKWYTAVATGKPEPKAGESEDYSPDEKLSLAQVTYVLEGDQWQQLGRQIDFGTIYTSGGAGNPPMEDEEWPPYFEKQLPDGAIIGYPIVTLEFGGIALRSYAMFRTAPDTSGQWIYAGGIATGSDNGADCDPQETPDRCYDSRGTLIDTGRLSAEGWPEFEVRVTGTVIAGGKRHRATAENGTGWHFDPAQSTYVEAAGR